MKKLLPVVISLVTSLPGFSQNILIQPATSLKTSGNVSIVLDNTNLINEGSANFSSSNLTVTGSQANVNMGGTNALTVNQLTINKNSGNLSLGKSINVTKEVIFQKGNLNLNGFNVILSSTGSISGETNSRGIIGDAGGEAIITTMLNAPFSVNPGNLGAVITSAANLGSVTIARGHKVQTNNGIGQSIKRYYTITPTNNTGLNSTLRFNYFDKELNGLTESGLQLFYSNDSRITWVNKGFTQKDATANFVELNLLSSLSSFTLSTSGFSSNVLNINKSVNQPGESTSIQLKPNPVKDIATLTINSALTTRGTLTIVSADGKIIIQKAMKVVKGFNQIPIQMSNVAPGIYNISLDLDDGVRQTIPFAKQ